MEEGWGMKGTRYLKNERMGKVLDGGVGFEKNGREEKKGEGGWISKKKKGLRNNMGKL